MKRVLTKKNSVAFILIILVAILSRCVLFLKIPNGIHQDEAYALYESWSLLNYGIDSWGYINPVYFISWGSGMNVLLSYIAIPFVKIFGLKVLSIRLPMLIISILTLVYVYFLGKELKNRKFAILILFLVTISPWHFMASRWAIESNLAPAFLIFSLYFLIKGTKNTNYYILAALLFGLTLYSYATIWVLVPFFLLLVFSYLLYTGSLIFDKKVTFSIIVLTVVAIPLILFLLINNGVLPEIKTDFFSIPKLLVDRSNEISFSALFNGAKQLVKLIFFQVDDRLIDSTIHFGLYYHISIIFIIIGLVQYLKMLYLSIKKRVFSKEAIFSLFLLACLFNACLIQVIVIVRVNFVHIPLLFCCANGLYYLYEKIKCSKKRELYFRLVFISYSVLFILFQVEYYTETARILEKNFDYGVSEAIQFAESLNAERIHVNPELVGKYSILLCTLKVSPQEFIAKAKYFNYPAPYLYMESFGKYQFYMIDYDYLDYDGVYVIREGEEEFKSRGFDTMKFGTYYVAWREDK